MTPEKTRELRDFVLALAALTFVLGTIWRQGGCNEVLPPRWQPARVVEQPHG